MSATFREYLQTGAEPVEVARAEVSGTYQLGGNAELAVWRKNSPPPLDDTALELPVGTVHTLYLRRGETIWAACEAAVTADTPFGVWLVWPDE